jgi:ATP-dependent helicase/nuclease subunit B
LKAVDELDGEVGKRDFGLWLHDVLKRFHEALLANPTTDTQVRHTMLEAAAGATTSSMDLQEGEFLPFAAAWPQVRDQYLQWLVGHEASTAGFVSAETSHRLELGAITLVGRIDRLDRTAQGETLVIDYKTEPLAKTRLRAKEPLEDTQMAFYAALLPDDSLRGMYLNVSERDGTKPCEQYALVEARDALIEGIVQDVNAIAAGSPLPALGEGAACDYCDARGLCRKDFWAAP